MSADGLLLADRVQELESIRERGRAVARLLAARRLAGEGDDDEELDAAIRAWAVANLAYDAADGADGGTR